MHSRGLKETAVKYNRYVVNVKLFCILAHDVGRSTQNSIVCVPTVEGEMYYGQLTDIIESTTMTGLRTYYSSGIRQTLR
jgi:hypothetical protein